MAKNYFFQVCLSGSEESGAVMPETLVAFSKGFQILYPDCRYQFYGDIRARQFLETSFDKRFVAAYQKLVPLAYRADFIRYCLVYYFGGWYADITLKPCYRYKVPDKIDFLYFYDQGDGLMVGGRSPMDCANGLFFARKGHPVLASVIASVLNNCEKEFYGLSSLSPTGPTLFGQTIASHVPNLSIQHGHFVTLTPFHKNRNRAFVAPDGTILALHKSAWHQSMPGGGDLSAIGLSQTNNYNKLWRERRVYRKS